MINIETTQPLLSEFDDSEARFLFTGDLVLTDTWKKPPFGDSLYKIIKNSEYTCVNLEAPIESGDPITKSGPVLSTIKETPEILSNAGFDTACLANNHLMDYGYDGVEKTINACEKENLTTVGTGKNSTEAIKPYVFNKSGCEVALFNICQHEFGIASATQAGTAWIDTPGLIRNIIKTSEKVDITFVSVHGGNEYVPLPSIRWQERLRELIDAGADAVIGHHPHVPQGWEIYNGFPIFYSLGNFVFDQARYDANHWGYCVQFNVNQKKITSANVFLTERIGQRIFLMGKARDTEVHYDYLKEVSDITENSPTNPGYWQEVAHQLYTLKYKNGFFRGFGSVDPVTLYNSPLSEIKHIYRLITNWPETSDRNNLALLNFIRAEAHREAIITGLEVETETVNDYRTPQIQSTVENLYDKLHKGVE